MPNHLSFQVDSVPVRLFAHEPEASGTDQKHPAIVLLHGASGNLDFWTSRLTPFLQQANVALYAPHYFDRTNTTYADLATMQDRANTAHWLSVIDQAIHIAAARPRVDPEQIVLAGISLGGFLALAFSAGLSASHSPQERSRLRALVEISGGLVEPYASQATRHFPPTLILHGSTDNIVPATYAQALDRRLTALDVAHRTEILPAEGHWFSATAVPRILLAVANFLQNHLQSASIPQRAM